MKLYVCGAVPDILREFTTKVERIGHEVVGAQEWRPSRSYNPPVNTEAVIVGTDQTGHPATDNVINICKERGLPYAMGELRKWSLIYPRMLQAGIHPPIMAAPEEEEVVADEAVVREVSNEQAVKTAIADAVLALVAALEKQGATTATVHYQGGRARIEYSFMATATMDL